jgi:hypothetical protein
VVGRGGNRTVSVVFQPNSTGNFTGIITVNSDATSGNSTIAASGTGVLVPVITGNLTASGEVGENFSYQITATNSPISYAASGLPAGLTLNATTGLISGMPSAGGNFPVTISATNSGGTGTANLTVAISDNRTISITIAGSRATVGGKPGIRVEGVTVGFENGDTVIPYVRFPGETTYTQAASRPVITDGEFVWERKTGKKVYVYFTSKDGSVQSNRVIIQAN